MTLDEAIKRFSDNAEYERSHGSLQGCLAFRQLAEWLTELKELKKQTGWIPVSERFPTSEEQYRSFLVTNEYGRVSIETFYLSIIDKNPYFGGTGNVIAWMPLPQPYKTESEDKE